MMGRAKISIFYSLLNKSLNACFLILYCYYFYILNSLELIGKRLKSSNKFQYIKNMGFDITDRKV